MNGNSWLLKKPKPEPDVVTAEEEIRRESAPPPPPVQSLAQAGRVEDGFGGAVGGGESCSSRNPDLEEQEEALIALIEHRTKEVEHLRRRVTYYQKELEDMERRLHDSKSKLARIRSRNNERSSQDGMTTSCLKEVGNQKISATPVQHLQGPSQPKLKSKPKLVLPDIDIPPPRLSQPTMLPVSGQRAESSSGTDDDAPLYRHTDGPMQMIAEKSYQMAPPKDSRKGAELSSIAKVDVPSLKHSDNALQIREEKTYRMSSPKDSRQRAECSTEAEVHMPSSQCSDRQTQKTSGNSHGLSPQNDSTERAEWSSKAEVDVPSFRHSDSPKHVREEKSYGKLPSNQEFNRYESTGSKRKRDFREHKELIPYVRTYSSPRLIRCQSSVHIPSQHKRKLKSLSLCPINDKLFITSALDGMVNLWQLQAKGSGATLLSSSDCLSPSKRKWPEDIAWHPSGNMLFSVYTADSGDNQISVLDLNKTYGRDRVTFLEDKPHVKGLINSILFMPWDVDDVYFVTGGCDHSVFIWKDCENNIWKPSILHRNVHSSAVMGVAGLRQKKIVMSSGLDKRIIGFDVVAERVDYKYQIESKCMSILPNPCDFNLFMVQTGAPQRQLRLYDIRLRQTELHAFGWKQESSESQSALINQSWSPDGLYITSGSADPMIHIFDIRYKANKPCQSLQAHQKRVFKAVWHSSVPVLTSISSDLNIGHHQIS